MKAILEIELNDEWLDRINITCDEMFADITVYKKESLENQCDYSQRIYRCWCPLKPMPEKLYWNDNPNDCSQENARARGWNACIDELLGEEND